MRQFGLIGYPLTHSFSEAYFTEKFRKENIPDCAYRIFPVPSPGELPALLQRQPDIAGLNVTIPYKESVIPHLDELDETARAVGAVNVIRILNDNTNRKYLIGYNSDIYGFEKSLTPLLKSHHAKALVLGSGGAAKAVCYVLQRLGLPFSMVSRTRRDEGMTYGDIDGAVMEAHRLIINATPLGMHPRTGDFPPVPYQHCGAGHLFYDLVYNPAETVFMKKGRERGATVVNGLEMLRLQAEKAWEIWNADGADFTDFRG